MNKKRLIIGTIIIMILSFIFHSIYDKFPNLLTSLFFPVNESIFEHNKMILLSFFVWSLIEKRFFKTGKSTFFIDFIAAILCILILDLTFTPIYLYILHTNDNMIVIITLYIISIILAFIISEKFIVEYNRNIEILGICGFFILSITFMILTYNPPKLAIFYDYSASHYGIKEK